jgi:single-strand DNA-binding protein
MMNRIVLIGRLTQDPELRYTNSGTAVASFTLAVDRPRTNQAGERETDFIPIVVWQKQAETVAQYLQKGRLAAVDGRLQLRSYENREGQKVRVAEVVAESVRFLDKASNGTSSPSAAPRPTSATAKESASRTQAAYADDPFADDLDISDDDLPF